MSYLYLLVAVATVLLFQAFLRSAALYRAQVSLLLLGVLLPWVVNGLDLSGRSPVPQLDLTSMVFSVTGLLLVPGLLRLKMLDLVPVARDLVIQGMRDAVIVLDPSIRIVDLNRAAKEPRPDRLQPDHRGIGNARSPLLEGTRQGIVDALAERLVEIAGLDPADGAVFDLRISRLNDGDQPAGWVFVPETSPEPQAGGAGAAAGRRGGRPGRRRGGQRGQGPVPGRPQSRARTPLTPVLATVSAMLERDEVPEIRPTLEMICRNVEARKHG